MKIKQLRERLNISQSKLAKDLGFGRSTICQYEKGTRTPDNKTLMQLADYFGVTVDYLLGRNESYIENEVDLNDNYAIPLVGRVVAGMPVESEENIEGYIYINYKPKEDYFALRVRGDSMIGAGIRDGAILVVRKQNYADNNDIIVALLNGEQTVKRFKQYSDSAFLMPENQHYEPIPIPKDADFLILGKVVEIRIAL